MVANAPAGADITPIWRAEWPAAVLVLGVAITWGASFRVVKSMVGEVSPPRLVGWRFIVATVTLLKLRSRVLYELNRRTLTRGSVLGALLGIDFVLCTMGHADHVGVDLSWHRFPWGHCHRRRLPCVELGADAAGFDHDCGDLDPRAVGGSGPGRRPG